MLEQCQRCNETAMRGMKYCHACHEATKGVTPMFEASVTNPTTGEIMCSYNANERTARTHLADSIYEQLDTDEAVMMLFQPVIIRELSETEAAEIRRMFAQE